MRTEDGNIIRKCLNGESEAFAFLVDKYRESVYAFAYSKLRNFHDAEDITQEVFFKAYQKLRTLKRWDSFLGWLYSITSNLCKNWTRSQSRRPDGEFIEDKDPKILEIPSIDSYRERQAHESLRESLNEALDALPEAYRLVLTLHYLGGLSNRDIARFLGTSPNAAKQKLMRARAQMKEEMLAMMSEAYKTQKLPIGFTFHVVEAIKRMKIQPTPRPAGLPWGISIAAGVIIAILSIGSHLNLPDLIPSPVNSAQTDDIEMSEAGEMPVEILRMSQIPAYFGSQRNEYGKGFQISNQQNAVLLAPRGEGEEWPEEPNARMGRGSVEQIAYSTDGKLLAAVGTRGITLYDADSLDEVGLLKGPICTLASVAFSPDGKMIAAGTGWVPIPNKNYAVHLWDIQDQKYVRALLGHTENVTSVAFSPDGKTVASASYDKTIRLWDVEERKQIGLLKGDMDYVYSVAFSPDGKTLAAGGYDKTIRLWDVNEQKQVAVLSGHTGRVFSIAFSLDGDTLASGSSDNTVRLWDVKTQKQVDILQGHTARIISIAFSPDGMTVISASWDDTVRFWDINKQKQIGMLHDAHTGGICSIALSPDGEVLASAGGWLDSTVCVWDIQTQEQLGLLRGYTDTVASVAFSPDSKLLVSGGWDYAVRLWDVESNKRVGESMSHQGTVRFVAFSPDGEMLASCGDDNLVRLWDVDTQKPLGVLKGHTVRRVLSVAFSPDGKLLASGGDDSTIRLWDVESQKQIGLLQHGGGGGEVWSVGFSPDGKTLASGGYTIRLWDVDTQKRIGALPEQGVVLSLAFSPDGRTLASGNWWRTVRLWNYIKEEQLGILYHSDHVGEVAFSPDGSILASGSDDKTLRLWDVKTQEQVCLLREHTLRVSCVAFSPDGKWLASGSADGTILLWEVNLDEAGISIEPVGKLPSTWGEVKKTELLQNFPNPFNPETWIPYSLSKPEHVIIKIYSTTGQLVRTLDLGQKPSGAYLTKEKAAYWDGRNEVGEIVASDVYFCVIEAGKFTDSRKMVMAR